MYIKPIDDQIKVVKMKILIVNTFFIFLLFMTPTFVLSSIQKEMNETDGKINQLKSNHPYSNLWFLQRIIGFIGFFLNSLGLFTDDTKPDTVKLLYF